MTMRRHLPSLCLLAVFLASCSAPATPVNPPSETPAAATQASTVTPAPPSFRVVAYATDGIIEELIPYG